MPGERMAVGVCLAVGVAGGATACSAVLGIQDPIPVGFFDGGLFDVVVTDSTRPTDGTGGDVTVDVPPYETGPCPPMTPDPTQAIFVATGVGTDSADCGSPMAPCQTVQVGVNRARTVGRPLVYLNRGVYSESVMLAAGVTIQGGWDDFGGTWTKNCDPTAAVVQALPTSNVTFTADGLGGTAALDTLTVLSKGASAVGGGESIYGIMALGATTTLNLATVLVRVVDGGAGLGGSTGTDGTPGGTGGCSPSGTGSNGTQGPAGSGAPPGTFSAQGYSPNQGGLGMPGGGGDNGPVGSSMGGCTDCGSCGFVMVCTFTPDGTLTCSYGGLGGCGGGGGTGGGGGGGGGSSIALFAWDATVNATGGTLQSGNGGAGADGGFGGASGPGGPGANGTADPVCTTACDMNCNSLLNGFPPGGPGGVGGNGGTGGQGGGGAGGMSYAVVQGGAATVMLSSVQLLHGQAGPGGNVGGAPGNSGDHYP